MVYLDNAATSPMDPEVAAEMLGAFGAANPSSMHLPGREARARIDRARRQVAALFHASPECVIFTSGGTEAAALAIGGTLLPELALGRCHAITTAFEHPAVNSACESLVPHGLELTKLRPSADGIVSPDDLLSAFRPDTRLVSIMAANNVVGTLQPISEMARICREKGIAFHTDAVQAAGKVDIDLERDPIDLISVSAHKLYGPKGVGAVIARDGRRLRPLMRGGGQESGLRGGTENVPGIVGFGHACEMAGSAISAEAARLVTLREQLIETVLRDIPSAYLIGSRFVRLPGHACFGFRGIEGEAMHMALELDARGFAISTGSACSQHGGHGASETLLAMGFDAFRARGALRVTLGKFNTSAEVERFCAALTEVMNHLRPIDLRAARAARKSALML